MITVVSVAGIVTVQDAGRPGHMREGVPVGGALVPELLARANAAARNHADEPCLEVVGTLTLAATTALELALDDGATLTLEPGRSLTVSSAGVRARYLATRGGLDVPSVLGGRGTLVVAGLGGHEGRMLRKGDVLPVGSAALHDAPLPAAPDLEAVLRVVPGPDLDRFGAAALEVLTGSTFHVDPRSDRMGVRLGGPAIPRRGDDSGPSGPMVRGAIQIPPGGAPIVLGPDHPTTGGYPVLATLVRADFGALGARVPGASVRFVVGPVVTRP